MDCFHMLALQRCVSLTTQVDEARLGIVFQQTFLIKKALTNNVFKNWLQYVFHDVQMKLALILLSYNLPSTNTSYCKCHPLRLNAT